MPSPMLANEPVTESGAGGENSDSAKNAALSKRGVAYLAARYGGSALVNAGNVFVLTWWIGPRAYGAFVTAVGITTFLASMARAGLDTHLVRSEEPPVREDFDTAITLILGISLSLCVLGALALPLLTRWLPDKAFALPYLVLLITVPLVGLAGPPLAALERELQFQSVAKIEFGGQVSAFLIGAVLAWRGMGVWAPVAGHLTWQLFVLCGAVWKTGEVPRLRLDRARARRMLGFGLGFSASVRVWQLRSLVNPLIVGRFLGTEAVAFVALAMRAVEALSFVRTAVGRVAIAALSRLREDPQRCRRLMERGARLQIFTLGSAFAVVCALGPMLLPKLLGTRWSSALVVLPFAAVAALVNSVFVLEASALFVEGRQWIVTQSYVWHVAILSVGATLLLPVMGIAGYGVAELVACVPFTILHRGLRPDLRIAMPSVLFGLGAFALACLSSLATTRVRWALWIPLALLAWMELRRWMARSSSVETGRAWAPTPWFPLRGWISMTLRESEASGD